MGSKTFDGVWFIAFTNDHLPPHIHGKYGGTTVILELDFELSKIRLSKRRDRVTPRNAKKSDVARIRRVAIEHSEGVVRALGESEIMRNVTVDISDEEIDAALEEARNAQPEIDILEAEFHSQPGLEFLRMKLSDGRTLLVPREELSELKNATIEQAKDIMILTPGASVWWPQLDDGIYLADFLEYRWGKVKEAVVA